MTNSDDEYLPSNIECAVEGSRTEAFVWESPSDAGTIIFPRGAEQFADDNQVQLIRISGKTGVVEILQEIGAGWREVNKTHHTAQIQAIKNG